MQALPPDPPKQEIVITARALPDPAAQRAYAVDTIDAKRLENAPSTQLDQVLKDIPGLQLFRRSDARSSHPTSQGVTLRALGGNAASRVLLVLDGVPQADPFGGWVNWPAYDPASIGEVRVVRGGGSVADGPGALAGVIEMRSLMRAGAAGELSAGSRQSVQLRGLGGFDLGGGTFNLSSRGARSDGFVPVTEDTRGPTDQRAPYKEASARAFWTAPISADTRLQLSALGFTDRRERGVPFTANRTDGFDASFRLIGDRHWKWSAVGYGQWRELESSFASVNSDRSAATRVSLQDSVPSHALGGSFEIRPPLGETIELRLGGDARFMDGESRELFAYSAGEPTRRRVAGGNSQTAGLFGEVTSTFGRVTLSGGVRTDHWRISDGELVEHVIASGNSVRDEHYPSRSGWLPTARAGAVLDAGGGFSLRSAAYLGWRMPTLNELFRPFRAGSDATAANPFLDPERLSGAEAGLRYSRSGVSVSVTAFANRLRNAIANVTVGETPGGGQLRQRQNLDSIRVHGIEASAEFTRGEFSLGAGLSFTDAKVKADQAAAPLDGLRPAQTPRFAASASLGWERGPKALTISMRHVGAQFEDDLNVDRLKPATTIDIFGSWPLMDNIQLIARSENLLDEVVEAGIGGDGAIERATPRTLWIGLRFR